MNKRYTYTDPIFRTNTRYSDLKIDSRNSLLRVFRLISGTINCYDDFKEKNYLFRNNYLELPFQKNDNLKQSVILDCFPDEVTLNDLSKYFRKSRTNQSFYETIEVELIKCLIANEKKDFLESFFYLYRVIEGISYSIPLIYTSKSKSYKKSYSSLKSFFGGKDESELAFFKKFIKEIFHNEDFFKTTVDINLMDIEIEELRTEYYNLYSKYLQPDQVKDSTESEEIKVSFVGFYEFLITIRCRFFHFAQGTWQENLTSTEVLYADFFFQPLVDLGLNWVSVILFEVLKVDFENH